MIVDNEKAGFLRSRNILTHIVLAQEVVRDLSRKSARGNVIFKVDITKAYDRLEWRSLLRALKAFGFSHEARDLIYMNICHIIYSLVINGESVGYFRSFWGVHSGDSLSLLLFVLAQRTKIFY